MYIRNCKFQHQKKSSLGARVENTLVVIHHVFKSGHVNAMRFTGWTYTIDKSYNIIIPNHHLGGMKTNLLTHMVAGHIDFHLMTWFHSNFVRLWNYVFSRAILLFSAMAQLTLASGDHQTATKMSIINVIIHPFSNFAKYVHQSTSLLCGCCLCQPWCQCSHNFLVWSIWRPKPFTSKLSSIRVQKNNDNGQNQHCPKIYFHLLHPPNFQNLFECISIYF